MNDPDIYAAGAVPDRLPDSNEALMLLRARVAEVMAIEELKELAAGQAVAFKGRLRIGAQEAFDRLKARFADLGYVPLLRESDSHERQEVMAIRGSLQALLTSGRG